MAWGRRNGTSVIVATVRAVHGDYAVVYPKDKKLLPANENITFSLTNWQGENPPKCGQVVELTDVVRFERGWRANAARPVRL